MSQHTGGYPGCYYYTDSCFRDDCKKKVEKESESDRYWREMRERQTGENKPDYDSWTGSYY